jgi:hypothetical protein
VWVLKRHLPAATPRQVESRDSANCIAVLTAKRTPAVPDPKNNPGAQPVAKLLGAGYTRTE